MSESKLLYLPDVARELGKTESAVRSALQRKSDAVPAPSRLGRKLVWRRADFEAWLNDKLSAPRERRRRGRPRKSV